MSLCAYMCGTHTQTDRHALHDGIIKITNIQNTSKRKITENK